MPDYVTIQGKVVCPHCNEVLASEIRIQWGKVPRRYHVGQEIEWLTSHNVLVPSFTLVSGSDSWNCGDRNCERVLAFDCDEFARDNTLAPTCPYCMRGIGGVYADISDNVIAALVACTEDDVSRIFQDSKSPADIVEVKKDGCFVPRFDWFDHRIEFVERLS